VGAVAVAVPVVAVATLSNRSFGELYRIHFVAVAPLRPLRRWPHWSSRRLGRVATTLVRWWSAPRSRLQQYLDLIGDVPTIAELFVLNAIGAGVVCVLLTTRLRLLGALGGILLSAGALVSIAIARYVDGGLFEYVEPTFRTPVVIAVTAEVTAMVALAAYLVRQRRSNAR